MSKVLTVLKDARTIVENGWTQSSWARDKEGRPTEALSAYACSYCMQGAVYKASHDLTKPERFVGMNDTKSRVLDRLKACIYSADSIPEFNDFVATSKEEVLVVFDRAIEREEGYVQATSNPN